MQLLLTYSAFEYLLKCVGMEMKETEALLADVQRLTFLQNLRGLNGQSGVFVSARSHVNKTFQQQIDLNLGNSDCNPWYLAGALRHGFAHGALTATPAGVQRRAMGTVARFMCRAMVQVMDVEFRERVQQFKRAMTG